MTGTIIGYKHLILVDIDNIGDTDAAPESPVFESPYATKSICNECGQPYNKLIYQVGYRAEPHHFCTNRGGIYFYYPSVNFKGWTATLTVGGPFASHFPGANRGSWAVVHKIDAFCNGFKSSYGSVNRKKGRISNHRRHHQIFSGFTVLDGDGYLRPRCGECLALRPTYKPKFTFSINDNGEIYFALVSQA